MSDIRSANLVPLDARTHVTRINDWVGSNVWAQMSRRDRGDTPMPEGKTARYLQKNLGWDSIGRKIMPNSIVELYPSQVGPHHGQLDDEKYDAAHKAAFEAMNAPRPFPRIEEVIPLAQHTEAVEGLRQAVADRDVKIKALEKAIADEKARAELLGATVKVVDEAMGDKK